MVSYIARNLEPIRQFLNRAFGINTFDPNFYLLNKLPSVVEPGDVLTVVAMALGLSVVATLYPAWRAANSIQSTRCATNERE